MDPVFSLLYQQNQYNQQQVFSCVMFKWSEKNEDIGVRPLPYFAE
jgi:hypothetical protein